MFYRAAVTPKKPAVFVPPPEEHMLHLSQAALPHDAKEGTRASLLVKCSEDEEPAVLCTLCAGRLDTVPLDQFFSHYCEFSVAGNATIHISGYYAPQHEEDEEGMEGEMDDEDDVDYVHPMDHMMMHGEDEDEDEDENENDSDEDEDEDSDGDDEDEDGGYAYGWGAPPGRGKKPSVVIEEINDDKKQPGGKALKALPAPEPKGKQQQQKHQQKQQLQAQDDEEESSEDDEGESEDDEGEEDESEEEEKPQAKAGDKRKAAAEATPTAKKQAVAQQQKTPQQQQKTPQQPQQKGQADKTPAGKQQPAAAAKTPQQQKQAAAATPQGKDAKTPQQPAAAAKSPPPPQQQQQQQQTMPPAATPGSGKKLQKPRVFENGFEIHDVKMGQPDGRLARAGKRVSMRYVGRLKKNGKVFDSNTKGKPFSFRLGVGEVIKGWDRGVEGMRVGDKRKLVIPPQMAYGGQSLPGIPANSTLEFDVELVDVK